MEHEPDQPERDDNSQDPQLRVSLDHGVPFMVAQMMMTNAITATMQANASRASCGVRFRLRLAGGGPG
jgi:hypothetical protein